MISLQEVIKRKNKNPDNIDEVPVKTGVLHLICRILAHCGPDRNDREYRHAGEHVKTVKPGDHEKCRGKLRHSPRIMSQTGAVFNQMAPFEGLAPEKHQAAQNS